MSQQHTTQASGQGMLERVPKPREHGTMVRTGVITGFTTFLTMAYIVFANPQILGVASMDINAVSIMTCLIAAFGSIMMGLLVNLPATLAPAMGLNVFFSFVVVQAIGLSWQVGMGAIFWGMIGLLLPTIFRVHYWMITSILVSLCIGITSGIGLFISMTRLKNAGMIVANPETLVSIGNLTSHGVPLGILDFFIIAILVSHNIHAAVLVPIVMITPLGWMLGDIHYNGIVSASPSVMSVVDHIDLAGLFDLGPTGVIFSFMLVDSSDSSDTLISVTDRADLTDERGKSPRMRQALHVGSISSVTGSFIGTSFVTAYTESSSGVSVGGRTGLTTVVVGLLFLLVIFLSPLVRMVPGCAAVGVLIYIGVLMTSSLAHVNWQDLTESVPVFITAVMMSFSFSITEGIALDFISYCVVKIGTGRPHDLSPCVIIIALLSILKIVFVDAH